MKTLLAIITLTLLTLPACGASDEEAPFFSPEIVEMERGMAQPQPASADMMDSERIVEVEVIKEVIKEVEVPGQTVVMEAAIPMPTAAPAAMSATDANIDTTYPQAHLVTQRRIIVRTVDMTLVVDQIQSMIDRIADIAADSGGWVVSSDHASTHTGRISFRVPASSLDSTIERLRGIAQEVTRESTTSKDVTDEYVDLNSRLTNQQATESALLRLLDRAEKVEDALEVQRELSIVQETIERIQGRIKLLEETSAFSLVNVALELAPVDMDADAGPDQSVAVAATARFRATFSPPEHLYDADHAITWNFGDGSPTQTVTASAPTSVEGQRISATVAHHYFDPEDSPFIVNVNIESAGPEGVARGSDTLTVSVSEIPLIEVFAGEDLSTVQNQEVRFSGSFTRPAGLTAVRFSWDFGDGSPPVEGDLPEGVTRADATHVYADYRPEPYRARLTVSADSAVGEVSAERDIYIFVEEELGFVSRSLDIGSTFKSAVRSLTGLGQVALSIAIWLAVYSPIWGTVLAIALVAVWLDNRNRARRAQRAARQAESAPTQTEDPS